MKARQDGMSMVEVVIGFVLMTVVTTMLVGMTYATAAQSMLVADATQRDSHAMERLNQLNATPWDSLPQRVGCDTVGVSNQRYARCVTVETAGRSRLVQITTTPLQRRKTPSTLQFVRASAQSTNPLCTTC